MRLKNFVLDDKQRKTSCELDVEQTKMNIIVCFGKGLMWKRWILHILAKKRYKLTKVFVSVFISVIFTEVFVKWKLYITLKITPKLPGKFVYVHLRVRRIVGLLD